MKIPFYKFEDVSQLRANLRKECATYLQLEELQACLSKLNIRAQNSNYEIPDAPELRDASPDADAENAIRLHRWLKLAETSVPRTVFCDERLWCALCHETFANYMIRRWGAHAPVISEQLDDRSDIHTNGYPEWYTRIHQRFFIHGGSQRGVVRNGLARLYFAAELSSVDDDYSLTTEMFRKQDIHQNLIERSICTDRGLLQGILRKFKQLDDSQLTKPRIQLVAKLINGSGGTRTLDVVEAQDLSGIFDAAFRPLYFQVEVAGNQPITTK